MALPLGQTHEPGPVLVQVSLCTLGPFVKLGPEVAQVVVAVEPNLVHVLAVELVLWGIFLDPFVCLGEQPYWLHNVDVFSLGVVSIGNKGTLSGSSCHKGINASEGVVERSNIMYPTDTL